MLYLNALTSSRDASDAFLTWRFEALWTFDGGIEAVPRC